MTFAEVPAASFRGVRQKAGQSHCPQPLRLASRISEKLSAPSTPRALSACLRGLTALVVKKSFS